jgi:hypothetical protein
VKSIKSFNANSLFNLNPEAFEWEDAQPAVQAPSFQSTQNNALIVGRLSATSAFHNGKANLFLNRQGKAPQRHQLATRELAFAQPTVLVSFGKGFSTTQ